MAPLLRLDSRQTLLCENHRGCLGLLALTAVMMTLGLPDKRSLPNIIKSDSEVLLRNTEPKREHSNAETSKRVRAHPLLLTLVVSHLASILLKQEVTSCLQVAYRHSIPAALSTSAI